MPFSRRLLFPERIPLAVLLLGAAALLAFLFLEGMTSPLNHDEDHYLGGAMMARDHVIYQDFAYSAMPLHPLMMGLFLRVFPVQQPFWWFRAGSVLLFWIGGIVLFLTARRATCNDTAAALLATFLVFNSLVLYTTNGLISCHVPALTLAIGGAEALDRTLRTRRPLWAALCGLLFCAAAGFKLYYILLLPVVLIILFFFRREGEAVRKRGRLCAAFLLGTLPAGIPVLIVFSWNPFAFLFNNYLFHQYNTAWHLAMGETGRISLLSRVVYVVEKLGYTGNGAVAVVLILMGIGIGSVGLRKQGGQWSSIPLVWALLAITATIGGMLPRPMHLHYLTFPLPFYILLAASLYPLVPGVARHRVQLAMALCGIIVFLAGGRYLFQAGAGGLAPAHWVPNVVHREAEKIARALDAYPAPRQVTTLSPLLVIEAGVPFEAAFSSCAFFYRAGDIIPEEVQHELGLVQKGHAFALLEKDPPEGILVGFERGHEEEFLRFVEQRGYTAFPALIYGHGTLYLRPRPWGVGSSL